MKCKNIQISFHMKNYLIHICLCQKILLVLVVMWRFPQVQRQHPVQQDYV